jgi:hypothetical protein
MHPGSTFTHFGHDVAHTVFTAFMAAHRRFATVSRVPLFAHARSRGGLALATATVGRRTRCLGTTVNNSEQQQITTWSVLGTLPCSEHSSFRLKMILVPLVLYDNNNNTTTTQQQRHNHGENNVPASFDGAIEQRTIVAGSAFGAKADVVSAQAGTAAIVQTHVFFTGQTTTARWAMASTCRKMWVQHMHNMQDKGKRKEGKKERRKEGKKERRKEGQRFNRSVPATRERGSNSIVTTTGVSQ